jgi:hypothetical protein
MTKQFKFVFVEAGDRSATDSIGFRDTFPSRSKNQTLPEKLKFAEKYEYCSGAVVKTRSNIGGKLRHTRNV